jgi:mono/diheme cytochrome c family protein
MKSVNQISRVVTRNLWLLFSVIGIVVFAFSCNDVSKEKAKSPVAEGEEWYKSYCVMCHGENGDGQGHMADKLQAPPSDLRLIAQRRNGVFPDEEIAKIIAGVENVPGHNETGEMPAWFETFKKSENITDEKVLDEKISHIVAYLKSIQQ